MAIVTLSVGLDYHPGSVQVCVMDSQGKVLANGTRGNDAAEIDRVVRTFEGQIRAAIEVSPGASHLAHELVTKFGWSIDLAHPGYVARIKQSPDKTDFSDAKLLADLVRVGYLPKVWLAPPAIQDLRAVTRHRAELTAQKRATKLRVRAILRQHRQVGPGNAWTKAWLTWIRETAATLLAELGQVSRFRNAKQLSRFCGVSPRNASSGSRQADAGLIKASNPELRRVLIETAQRLILHDEYWNEFKQRMREQGKPYCVIVAAVANRWLRKMYHPLKALAG